MMSVSEFIALIITCTIMQNIFVVNYGNLINKKVNKTRSY